MLHRHLVEEPKIAAEWAILGSVMTKQVRKSNLT
jgi:hypothetical protein